MDEPITPRFPVAAGVWLGLGLGGLFDGIVFHQVLQWHLLLTSAGHPPYSVTDLRVNTLWDGLFHVLAYGFVIAGLARLWRAARKPHPPWPTHLLAGSLLLGFGLFNLVEGVVSHHLLGIHHVKETAPHAQWLAWDLGFLAWGAAMAVAGWGLLKRTSQGPAP